MGLIENPKDQLADKKKSLATMSVSTIKPPSGTPPNARRALAVQLVKSKMGK